MGLELVQKPKYCVTCGTCGKRMTYSAYSPCEAEVPRSRGWQVSDDFCGKYTVKCPGCVDKRTGATRQQKAVALKEAVAPCIALNKDWLDELVNAAWCHDVERVRRAQHVFEKAVALKEAPAAKPLYVPINTRWSRNPRACASLREAVEHCEAQGYMPDMLAIYRVIGGGATMRLGEDQYSRLEHGMPAHLSLPSRRIWRHDLTD
uniref:Uncharacterized protein n=1 Tax=viral metagenome TaxID=1070528 RepID=A0A6M3IY94_9ZZZZ